MNKDKLFKFVVGVVIYSVVFSVLYYLLRYPMTKALQMGVLQGTALSIAMLLFVKPLSKKIMRLFRSKEEVQRLDEEGKFEI